MGNKYHTFNHRTIINVYLLQKSKYRVTDRNIEFQIQKEGTEIWPRLSYDPVKPAWLKIDFEHFMFDDEDDSTTEEETVGEIKCIFIHQKAI